MRVLIALLFAAVASAQMTYHDLEIIPDQSNVAGELRFIESTGWTAGTAVNYVGFKGPASITTNFVYTLPNALPTSTTRCLEVTTGGVIQYAAGACGSGTSFYNTMRDNGIPEAQRAALNFTSLAFILTDDGGSGETEVALTSSPTNSTTLVGTGRLVSTTSPITGGGDFSIDRTIACATCVTTNTAQDITATKTFDGGNLIIEDSNILEFRNETGTLVSHKFIYGGANTTRILDSSAGVVISINSNFTPDFILFSAELLPGANNTFSIGQSDLIWDETHSVEFHAGSASLTRLQGRIIVANTDLTATTTASFLGVVKNAATAAEIPAIEVDNFAIGSSGSFYLRALSGGDVVCTNIDDGWIAQVSSPNELQLCEGAATFLIPYIATSFTPLTVNCGANDVLQNIRVENGIVVEGNCVAN